MATYKELTSADIKTSRSVLNQLVDVIAEDISGSQTRKRYQVFVTGGIGPGVTSSLFQTVYDQNFGLQTANPVLDLTFGIYSGSTTVANSSTGQDSAGKLLFPSNSLMMREKVDIYRQMSQILLGNETYQFASPYARSWDENGAASANGMSNTLFLCFKRLFSRDTIKRETFAMKFFQSASAAPAHSASTVIPAGFHYGLMPPNVSATSASGSTIFTDIGSSNSREVGVAGNIGNLVDASNVNRYVGLIFYDEGIVALDVDKVISGSQHVSGVIDAMSPGQFKGNDGVTTNLPQAGKTIIGYSPSSPKVTAAWETQSSKGNPAAKFIPDFVVSASMDNILDHFASCRFNSGSSTAITFQNQTNINSTLIFCRATSDEMNYSANPSFINSEGLIRVITDTTSERAFSFVTTIGLYDNLNNLLAVAKLSRPVEKNDEKDLTFRIRLDF